MGTGMGVRVVAWGVLFCGCTAEPAAPSSDDVGPDGDSDTDSDWQPPPEGVPGCPIPSQSGESGPRWWLPPDGALAGPCESTRSRSLDGGTWPETETRRYDFDGDGRILAERGEVDDLADGSTDDSDAIGYARIDHDVCVVREDVGADCALDRWSLTDARGRPLVASMTYEFDEHDNPLHGSSESDDCAYAYDEHDELVLEDCTEMADRKYGGSYELRSIATWTRDYDDAGRPIEAERVFSWGANESVEHWTWTWDDAGNRVGEVHVEDTDGDRTDVEWTYDVDHDLLTEDRSEEGRTSHTDFRYDCWDPPIDEDVACEPSRTSTLHFASVSAGGQGSCGIRTDGVTVCWGSSATRQPPPDALTRVEAGDSTACGLDGEGMLRCWGYSETLAEWSLPEGPFVDLALGPTGGCALRDDGSLACWGAQLTDPPRGAWTSVAVGAQCACALDEGGRAECWGNRLEGACTPPAESFSTLALAGSLGCGITLAGEAVCWGDAPPPLDGRFVRIDVADDDGRRFEVGVVTPSACGTDETGTLSCWGGEAGAPTDGRFTDVSLGHDGHACALRDDGVVVCWGNNLEERAAPP